MTALLTPSAFVIDVAKIQNYLLNTDHPVGKSKAVFFAACGFARARPDELANCLLAHASPDNLADSVQTPFGTKWIFEGPIQTPAGAVPGLRSVWIVRQLRPSPSSSPPTSTDTGRGSTANKKAPSLGPFRL